MTDERFKNRKAALTWLQSRGQISAGKFYQDCDAGMVTINPDKTVSKYQVMQYAEKVFGFTRQTAPAIEQSQRKENLEIDLLQAKVDRQQLENRKEDDRWMTKEFAWSAVAGLVHKMRSALLHQFHVSQSHIVTLAGGDQARAPEVYEGCEEMLNRAFNEICAAGHIDVMFEGENDE